MTGATAPPPALVITGASGFVGRRLLAVLAGAARDHITCLDRDPERLWRDPSWRPSWRAERADLANDSSRAVISEAITPGAVVLHLAAATGKARPDAMRAVNVEGTRSIAEGARGRGASHLIFVSSIAAGFRDRRWYHYAEAKRAAEALVAASGVGYSIVRPTLVFGPGSPIEAALSGLATGAAPLVLGSGKVVTQPIHVDDVASFLVALVGSTPANAVLEIGGADRLTMRELLARIREAHGLPPRATVPVPLGLLRAALGAVEPALRGLLPVTAGQFAAFVNDSLAAPNDLVSALLPAPRGIAQMRTMGATRG